MTLEGDITADAVCLPGRGVVVAMGDLVQGVTQQDYSVTGAILAISTFAVITSAVGYLNRRWHRARPITHDVELAVLEADGRISFFTAENA